MYTLNKLNTFVGKVLSFTYNIILGITNTSYLIYYQRSLPSILLPHRKCKTTKDIFEIVALNKVQGNKTYI